MFTKILPTAMFARLWARYNELLVTRPLISKGLTGGILFGGGDLLAQKLDGTLDTKGYTPVRTARSFFWSAVCFTPIGHYWYVHVLNKYLPATTTKAVLTKVALDQLTFSPFINAAFLSYSALSHGQGIEGVKSKCKSEYTNVLLANWTVWPIVQMINFKLVPVPLQMPVMNMVVFFWSAYLATVSARSHKKDHDVPQ